MAVAVEQADVTSISGHRQESIKNGTTLLTRLAVPLMLLLLELIRYPQLMQRQIALTKIT